MATLHQHSVSSLDSLPQNQCKPLPSVKFTLFDIVLTALSLLVYIADIITDIILGVQYLKSGYLIWGIMVLLLFVLPSLVTQAISLRWHIIDETRLNLPIIASHFFLVGIVQRYANILSLGITAHKKTDSTSQILQLLCHYQSDACLLRLFESFLESAPQLLLQLYIVHELGSWHPWTGVSVFASLLSLAWGIASYARTMRDSREDKARITWIGLLLQAVWRTGTMVSRMISLLLCASVIHVWFVLAISVHWMGMTIWTIKQKTDLCVSAWEERIYNGVVGVIYCFCFFNIKDGKSRRRAAIFYTVIATENAACVAIYLQLSKEQDIRPWFHTLAPILVLAGFILGHASQMVYYLWFHPSGPIKFQSSNESSLPEVRQEGNVITEPRLPSNSPIYSTMRTLKFMNRKLSGVSDTAITAEPKVIAPAELACAGTAPTDIKPPHLNSCITVENHSIRHIELSNPKLSVALNPHCLKFSSDSKLLEVNYKFPVSSLIKTKSDGQLHVGNSTILPTRFSACTNDTNSQHELSIISVHDYENMAALNVNRTDWGIRHWKSYSDIETNIHDYSVCKDRDLLESSLTSTSSSDSCRILNGGKITVEEAIAQLKSLAAHGHNFYQPQSNDFYEFLWINESDNAKTLHVQERMCPSTGHNLSTITEVSENSSTSSRKSNSSLVQTVDTVFDKSRGADKSTHQKNEHLTYVEISFLSKLSEYPTGSETDEPSKANTNKRQTRRQFSIIREKFESKMIENSEVQQTLALDIDKENRSVSPPFVRSKSQGLKNENPKLQSLNSPKQSTLSSNSRIFSHSMLPR